MLLCFAKEVDKGFLKENYKFLNIALGAAKFQAFRGEGQKKDALQSSCSIAL